MAASHTRFVSVFLVTLALAIADGPPAQADAFTPWQLTVSKSCPATATCQLLFPVTVANRRVEIEHINCSLSNTADELSYVALAVQPQNVLVYLPVSWQRQTGSAHFYVFNEPTSIFVPAGSQIRALANTLTTNGTMFFACTLTGTLVFIS